MTMDYATQAFVIAQQMNKDAPVGPEFGKAEPIGLFIVVALAVVVLFIGWAFYRRYTRFNRRRAFAEANGIDVFDHEAIDRAMEEQGVLDRRKQRFI